MVNRNLRLVAFYVLGIFLTCAWSALELANGIPSGDLALVIVLPLAWTFGFWPVVGPLVVVQRIFGVKKLLEEMATRIESGVQPTEEQIEELKETFIALAAEESALPEFIIRPVVKRGMEMALEQHAAVATSS